MSIVAESYIRSGNTHFRFCCDVPGCPNSLLSQPSQPREEAIADAKRDGFRITGQKGAEMVLCPECAS